MSVIRVGSTTSYAEGWDFVFGSGKTKRRDAKTKTRSSAGKKVRSHVAKKNAAKPAARRKSAKKSTLRSKR